MKEFPKRLPLPQLSARTRIAVAAMVTVCVAGIVFLRLWLPSVIVSEIEARTALRGLIAHVDQVGLGLGSVTLQGVSVRGADGTALDAHVVQAKVGVSPLKLLFGGVRDGVRYVELERPELVVDVAAEGFGDTVLALRRAAEKGTGRRRNSSADPEARPLPRIDLVEGKLSLRDGEGDLVRVEGASAHSEEGNWRAGGARVVVGARPAEVITLDNMRLSGGLRGRRPQLRSVEVSGGVLQWVGDDSASSTRGRTWERLRKVRGALAFGAKAEPGEAKPSPAKAAVPLIAEDLRVEARGLQILSARPKGPPTQVLGDLDVVVEGSPGGRFRARGGGKSRGGGRLSWDLHLQPSEARVEGNVALEGLPLSLVAPLLPPIPWDGLDRSRVDGRLALKGEGLEKVAAEGELRLVDLAIAPKGIAPTPVGPFGAVMRGKGTWIPAKRRLEFREASVESGAAKLALEGAIEWAADHYLFDLHAQLGKTRCADVLAAVPAGMLSELEQVRFDGEIAATLQVKVDSRVLDDTVVDFDVQDHCTFLDVPQFLSAERFRRAFVHRALEPGGEEFRMETGPGTPAWTDIDRISPFMIQAVIAHEDGRFFAHNGFAEPQIARALARNLKAGGYRFGASTITMQLVKNVYLHRDKLLARKLQEALITWWLEQRWNKKDILELYLNVIEYGPSVYGVRQAAWYYFGITPQDLSPAQAAFLAMVLPNPKRFHGRVADGILSPNLRSRIERFVKHMHARGRIDDEALAFAMTELADFHFFFPGQVAQRKQVLGNAKPPPFEASEAGFDAWDLSPADLQYMP